MNIALLEMGAENVWRVQLDGEQIPGYFMKDEREEADEERWKIYMPGPDGARQMKVRPKTREAAACLLVYEHLQTQAKTIKRPSPQVGDEEERDEVSAGS